jgi:hypothetical protein
MSRNYIPLPLAPAWRSETASFLSFYQSTNILFNVFSNIFNQPNVVVEWLTLLLRIWKVVV